MRQEPERRPLLIGALITSVVLVFGTISVLIVFGAYALTQNTNRVIDGGDDGTGLVAVETRIADAATEVRAQNTSVLEVTASAMPVASPTQTSTTATAIPEMPPAGDTAIASVSRATATATAILPVFQTPIATDTVTASIPSTTPDSDRTTSPETTPTAQPAESVVTTSVSAVGGNIRSGPGVENPSIGFVEQGDELVVLGVNNGWYLVQLGAIRSPRSTITGEQGWIAARLVDVPNGEVPEIPPTP